MSDTTIAQRDEATGRFLTGTKAGPGRPRGARNKLGEAFLEDLRDAWEQHGATALARCAEQEPGQFCRIVASLLPKDVNVNANIGVNAQSVLDTFRTAVAALGNKPPTQLPALKVVNARRS